MLIIDKRNIEVFVKGMGARSFRLVQEYFNPDLKTLYINGEVNLYTKSYVYINKPPTIIDPITLIRNKRTRGKSNKSAKNLFISLLS
jgi:hypothetical protein